MVEQDKQKKYNKDMSENQPIMSKWISVEERLPCNKSVVLAYSCKKRFMATYVLNGFYCFLGDSGINRRVTHWMNLPEPPEDIK